MSSTNIDPTANQQIHEVVVPPRATDRPLHRLAAARAALGVSTRVLAQRMHITVDEVRAQEITNDLPLSTLYQWSQALNVPIEELLADDELILPAPRLKRHQAIEAFKAAQAILQESKHPGIRRMAQTFIDQLVEVVPEVKELCAAANGGRRKRNGRSHPAVPRHLPEELFLRPIDGQ